MYGLRAFIDLTISIKKIDKLTKTHLFKKL